MIVPSFRWHYTTAVKNAIRRTDTGELGLSGYLGIPPADLFAAEHAGLLHLTSAIRYPVFVRRGDELVNYTGYSPPLLQCRLLREHVQTKLAEELGRVRQALVVPLGRAVATALQLLVRENVLTAGQCLLGFPHPAGGNGHRVRLFNEAKSRMREVVASWFENAARQQHEDN
jgi:hypothetical protein